VSAGAWLVAGASGARPRRQPRHPRRHSRSRLLVHARVRQVVLSVEAVRRRPRRINSSPSARHDDGHDRDDDHQQHRAGPSTPHASRTFSSS
ncbi:unnamed protein product, partial [Musa acuminata subsp. burmannicoides]